MKKLLTIVLASVLGLGLYGCSSNSDVNKDNANTADSKSMDENDINGNLNKFGGWLSNDIHTNMNLLDIYEKHGEDNGKDMKFVYDEYVKASNKITEYDTFITSLTDSKYDDLKGYWTKAKDELSVINEYLLNNEILSNAGDKFSMDKFNQYKEATITSLYDLGL